MRSFRVLYILLALTATTSNTLFAKENDTDTSMMKMKPAPVGKFYIGSTLDGGIFSTATMQRPGMDDKLGTLRFSYFFNVGVTFNYNLTDRFGLFTGVGIKNIGFIEKQGDSTVKHRSYNLDVPLAIKFGDLRNKNYFFAGIDLDMPFNYKEKGFVRRSHKEKFNEWFSDRTPTFMSGIFAGFSIKPGFTFKAEYYMTNFMNTDYTTNGIKPYSGYNVHLILLSIGADIHFTKPKYKSNSKSKMKFA